MKKVLLMLGLGWCFMLICGMNHTLFAHDGTLSEMQTKEVPATFGKGSLSEFHQWVASNLKYPQEAVQQGIQGRVIVSFYVDKEGKVVNITVLRSPSELLSQEVVRVMESAPRWNPGMRNGEPVSTRYTIPLDFKL